MPLPSLQSFVHYQDDDGRLHVCRPQSLVRRVTPVRDAATAALVQGAELAVPATL